MEFRDSATSGLQRLLLRNQTGDSSEADLDRREDKRYMELIMVLLVVVIVLGITPPIVQSNVIDESGSDPPVN